MSKNPKKKKSAWQQYIAIAFFMLIGAACGVLMVEYIEKSFGEGRKEASAEAA